MITPEPLGLFPETPATALLVQFKLVPETEDEALKFNTTGLQPCVASWGAELVICGIGFTVVVADVVLEQPAGEVAVTVYVTVPVDTPSVLVNT